MRKYENARDILPPELVKEIQKYVEGIQIYIPRTSRDAWGSQNGTKEEIQKRNSEISRRYRSGVGIEQLSEDFCLSEERVRMIIYTKESE